LPCVWQEAHGKEFFAVRFVRHTAESFFAVRPIKDARQRFERTAKAAFPVVISKYITQVMYFEELQ
jgi:hypothetical protein